MLNAFNESSTYCLVVANRCGVITGRESDC